jgi:hypothetical protein
VIPMSSPNTARNAILSWSNAAAAPHSSSNPGADGTGHNADAGIRPCSYPPHAADPPPSCTATAATDCDPHPGSGFTTAAADVPPVVVVVRVVTMPVACSYMSR